MAASRGNKNMTKVAPAPARLCYGRKISVHFGVTDYADWNVLKNGASDASALAERFGNALHFDEAHVFLDGEVTEGASSRCSATHRLPRARPHRRHLVGTRGSADARRRQAAKGFLVPVDAPKDISLKNARSSA